jgi:two-component system phosphate regulon sensor histidine kinase PhoR
MNKSAIRLIVFLMAVAMVGLISLQFYWISNSIKINDNKFRQNIYDALGEVIAKLERQEIYTYAAGRFDTIREEHGIFISGSFDSMINLAPRIGGVLTRTSQTSGNITGSQNLVVEDSMVMGNQKIIVSYEIVGNPEQGQYDGLNQHFNPWPFGFWDSLNEFQSDLDNRFKRMATRSQMVSSILNQIYSEYREPVYRIRYNEIGQLIKAALEGHGVDLDFKYGIVDKGINRIILSNLNEGSGRNFVESGFSVKLFPNDLFPSSQYLTVVFPSKTGFILEQIWFTLLSSVLLVLLIVFSFYYAITVIIRQKKLSDIKNDFINNMTHEFKTPIATVSLACEALQDTAIAKNENFRQRYIGIIRNENQRLGHQVEKVLQMATLDKEKFKLKLEKTDVHEIIDNVLDNIKITVEKRGGAIRKFFNATEHILITDQLHLINILNNLFDNANKYSAEKPEITVETFNSGDELRIRVTDKGIGMSKDVLNRIFEKFYRVPTGNVHDVKGFGLGLAYVKTMSEALGAGVVVFSQPGKGSTFELSFPIKNEQNTAG